MRARLLLERGVLERAPEVVHYPSPGVALIWDGALDDEERVGRVFRIDPDNLPQELRRIGKSARGEASRHFRLRVHAGRHASDKFDHRQVADDQRAVRLLGRQPTDGRLALIRQRVNPGLAEAADLSLMRRRDYRALAQPPHDCARQGLEGKGVGDVADSPSPPHPRHRELLGQELRRRSFPRDSGGHEVALGAIAKMDLYLGEHDLAVAGNLCCVSDAHARNDLIFRREPTPTL